MQQDTGIYTAMQCLDSEAFGPLWDSFSDTYNTKNNILVKEVCV
jgi:hypothetical protein